MRPTDAPKLGLVFPSEGNGEELHAIPITLPMGWKNSPPIFLTAKETVVDLANAALRCSTPALPHRLDNMSEAIFREEPSTNHPSLAGFTREPYLRQANTKPAAYMDIFVNSFLELAQVPTHWQRRVWKTLFHSLDNVFWPYDCRGLSNRKEVLLLKNTRAGDCVCLTCQVLLGWLIHTVNMTLSFPPHQDKRFKEILSVIPTIQKCIAIDRW